MSPFLLSLLRHFTALMRRLTRPLMFRDACHPRHVQHGSRPNGILPAPPCPHRTARKPDWAGHAVIRLRARMPDAGCRTIAHQFNRLYAHKGMTVSKSWVGKFLQQHRHAVLLERRALKHRRPRPVPVDNTWAADLTTLQGHRLFGLIDHGSRTCIDLQVLHTKTSIALLRTLLDAIERTGRMPRNLRTDNEACFTSRLFRFGLRWLGIRHQRTEVASPWQNGRIERFFGTLKHSARKAALCSDSFQTELDVFRLWYNHVRPHDYLNGRTPNEVLTGQQSRDNPQWLEAWNGCLLGWRFKPTWPVQ